MNRIPIARAHKKSFRSCSELVELTACHRRDYARGAPRPAPEGGQTRARPDAGLREIARSSLRWIRFHSPCIRFHVA
ncbi:hypothetical protein ARTSIC4J27_4157 [Pseudarthrobacter siccitolerans]|uniref:Uncharacterized protein n=1 Tax=Pseudarthrobacter siccitolerans TaxID=861266 RepID=A0A024H840_9MICC|nr:hypothetical protein ARTSIC4J27_4157 [Pseudarthrobacter siccitolerans]